MGQKVLPDHDLENSQKQPKEPKFNWNFLQRQMIENTWKLLPYNQGQKAPLEPFLLVEPKDLPGG